MTPDTIFRQASMTKPITGVAMMMLYEEGKWKPSDPIAKHIPEFANLKVYAGDKDGQPIFEAPAHPPTMGELMSHNAGFTYGLFGNSPVDKLYQAANKPGFKAIPLQAKLSVDLKSDGYIRRRSRRASPRVAIAGSIAPGWSRWAAWAPPKTRHVPTFEVVGDQRLST